MQTLRRASRLSVLSLVAGRAGLAGLAGLALVAATSSAARAEGCDDKNASGGEKKNNFHVEMRNGQKVHVIDTVIAVCGKVPRPSVVYVLQAKNINYEWETLKQDFLPLILASVQKAPF
jgi:hypothetical protein